MDTVIDKNIKMSFIVPVYKVEKYIQRCVQSIMEQSYRNIEIILVDDGSPDESGKIIEEIAKTDGRIKVIHQANAGVSAARNAGLEMAVGEYIIFVDGDDYIDSGYAEYFLKLVKYDNTDMAVSLNNFTVSSNEKISEDKIEIWDSIRVIEAIYLDKIGVAVWNKIYKKSIIEKHSVRFHPDIWYGEGMLFNIEYLQYVDYITVGRKKVYHQVENPDSAMRNFNLESNYCGLRSLDIQKAVCGKRTSEIEKAWRYHKRNFAKHILCGLVQTDAVKSHHKLYNKCKKEMRRNMLLPWKVDIPFGKKIKLTLFALFPYIISIYMKHKSKKAIELEEKYLSS